MPGLPYRDIPTNLDGSLRLPVGSVQVTVVEGRAAYRVKRIGVYANTRYGRCVYGTQSGIYGRDKYNQATYD